MLNQKTAKRILKIYKEAWEQQNIDKILSTFHKNGIYAERILSKKHIFKGHKQIAKYWKEKVCEEQSKIKFKVRNYFIDRNTLIAEWDVSFNSNIEKTRMTLREVAIMEIKGNKIMNYREFWHKI